MSLYDDIDTDKKPEGLSGWASGIKFLQSHMQLKKATLAQPKRDLSRKQPSGTRMAPVVDFKAKPSSSNVDSDDSSGGPGTLPSSSSFLPYFQATTITTKTDKKGKTRVISAYLSVDPEWQFDHEYDPLYPNDYERALKEMRERRDKEAEESESRRKQESEDRDDDDEFTPSPRKDREAKGGVAIAPPPSLTQSVVSAEYGDDADRGGNKPMMNNTNNSKVLGQALGLGSASSSGLGAAARIMAKYGYKEGQGLGKKEQGMSTALLVEKTSHRIGRIIHEKDLPKEGVVLTNPLMGSSLASSYIDDEEEIKIEPSQFNSMPQDSNEVPSTSTNKPPMADTPSKVVLLTNMVGPGEVDDDLEPEVKEECEKYGEVVTVTVFQMPDVDSEDAIRIFVEFTTIDAARRAIGDLNGRYFGGREVKAHFYDAEKFNNLELTA